MDWRYELARRLAVLTLVISVVMMILLPAPKREVPSRAVERSGEE